MSRSVMEVIRQHESTTLVELEDAECENFVGVHDRTADHYEVFYLVSNGVSHRFFLNAGLLFWRSHQNRDSDDDLVRGD